MYRFCYYCAFFFLLAGCQLNEPNIELQDAYDRATALYPIDAEAANKEGTRVYKIAQSSGDLSWRAKSAFFMGLVTYSLQNEVKAYGYFHEARLLYQKIGDHEHLNKVRYSLAVIENKAGNKDEAKRILNLAIPFFERQGKAIDLANAYYLTGRIHAELGEFAQAKQKLHKAMALHSRADLQYSANRELGLLHRAVEAYDSSAYHFNEALGYAKAANSLEFLAETYGFLSFTLLHQQRVQEALESAKLAIALIEDSKKPLQQLPLLYYYAATACLYTGEVDEARGYLGKVPQLAQELGYTEDWYLAMQQLTFVASIQQDHRGLQEFTELLKVGTTSIKERLKEAKEKALKGELLEMRVKVEMAELEATPKDSLVYLGFGIALFIVIIIAVYAVQTYRMAARAHLYNHKVVQERDWLHVKVLELMRDKTGLSHEEVTTLYQQATRETPMDSELQANALRHTTLFNLINFFHRFFPSRHRFGGDDDLV